MIKPNPFANEWQKYDDKLSADNIAHQNEIFYKSKHEPMFRTQGVFSNGRLNINLSDMYTFIIQEVGRWCEYYASDLFITYDSIEKAIKNTNPDMPTEYRFIGIRQSGIDDVAYVISRMSQDNPIQLQNYYRKLYAIRITHEGLHHSPANAAYVYVELRDFTNHITSIASDIQKSGFTVNDYYETSRDDRIIEALTNLHDMESTVRYLENTRNTVIESINKIPDKQNLIPEQIYQSRDEIAGLYEKIHQQKLQLSKEIFDTPTIK